MFRCEASRRSGRAANITDHCATGTLVRFEYDVLKKRIYSEPVGSDIVCFQYDALRENIVAAQTAPNRIFYWNSLILAWRLCDSRLVSFQCDLLRNGSLYGADLVSFQYGRFKETQ